jgi:hypothetical protein
MKQILKNKVTIPFLVWLLFAAVLIFQLVEFGKFNRFFITFTAIGFISTSIAMILIDPNDKKENKGDKDNG